MSSVSVIVININHLKFHHGLFQSCCSFGLKPFETLIFIYIDVTTEQQKKISAEM